MNNSAKTAPARRDLIPPAASLSPAAGLGPLGVAALIIAALFVGREVFVPVALAVLLSFLTVLDPHVSTRGETGRIVLTVLGWSLRWSVGSSRNANGRG
jgi:hypothetical protein